MLNTIRKIFNFIVGNKEKKKLTAEERMAKIKKEAEVASLGRSEPRYSKYNPHTAHNSSKSKANKNKMNYDDSLNTMFFANSLYNNYYNDDNYDKDFDHNIYDNDNKYQKK